MQVLPPSILGKTLPQLVPVTQRFPTERLADPVSETYEEITKLLRQSQIKPNGVIGLGVGSRGIRNLPEIVTAAVQAVKDYGAQPRILPAMGSHGSGTAEGQLEVLHHLGITESTVGAPIQSSMEVTQIGTTSDGIPIWFDSLALSCNGVIPINRIKPHTDFGGDWGSGIAKMLMIGFANHEGCSRMHQEGFDRFPELLPQVLSLVLKETPVIGGLAILENGYDETLLIAAVEPSLILQREPELLTIARDHMPKILFRELDVLVVKEIGKDISGAGMDPNITGRTTKGILEGYQGPTIRRIIVSGLSKKTAGNAIGIGLADYTLKSVAQQIDWPSTYTNALASGNPESGKLPVVMDTLDLALRAALMNCGIDDWSQAKIAVIHNTLDLSQVQISPALLKEAKAHPQISFI